MATSPNINTHVLPIIPTIFPDHIYHDHPTLMKLIDKGEKQDGGLNYAPNRISAVDNLGTWFAGTTLSAVVSSASQTSKLLNETYNWYSVINPITLTYDERLRANQGPQVKIAMIEAKKKQAKLDHMTNLAAGVINGAGDSNKPYGVAVYIDPSATFGGVVPGTDTDWVSKAVSSQLYLSGPSVMQNLFQACLWNNRKPDAIPTTEVLFSRCANMFEQTLHYQQTGAKVERGIDTIRFKGAEVYMDRDLADYQMWMLNMEVLHLFQSSQFFLKTKTPEEPTAGTDIHLSEVGYILSSFIFGADERRVAGGALLMGI